MKKIAIALLASATAIALAGCSQEAAEPAPEVTETPAMEAPVEVAEEPTEAATDAPVDAETPAVEATEEAPAAE